MIYSSNMKTMRSSYNTTVGFVYSLALFTITLIQENVSTEIQDSSLVNNGAGPKTEGITAARNLILSTNIPPTISNETAAQKMSEKTITESLRVSSPISITNIAIGKSSSQMTSSPTQKTLLDTTTAQNAAKNETDSPLTLSIIETPTTVTLTSTKATSTSRPRKKIRILGLLDFISTQDRFTFGSAVSIAEILINQRNDILPNHVIDIVKEESSGSIGLSLHYMYTALTRHSDQFHAVIGPSGSDTIQFTSELSKHYGVIQMSFVAQEVRSASENPYLFKSNPSRQHFIEALIQYFQYNQWDRAALFFDFSEQSLFDMAVETQREFEKREIDLEVFERFDSFQIEQEITPTPDVTFEGPHLRNLTQKIKKIKESDIRIIVTIFQSPNPARVFFCEAYKQGLFGERYTWIVAQGTGYRDWPNEKENIFKTKNCTNHQLREIARGSIQFRPANKRGDSKITIANMTVDEIVERIEDYRNTKHCSKNCHPTYLDALYAFDVVWALALAFDQADRKGMDIENFRYEDFETVNKLAYILENVEFEGATGFYKYEKSRVDIRNRAALIAITQYNDLSNYTNNTAMPNYGTIGYYDSINGTVTINNTHQQIVYPGYKAPRAGPLRLYTTKTFHLAAVGFVWLCSIVGMIMALAFLYINIRYKDEALIKMSSPNINNMIILGCICCYLSAILYGLDTAIVSEAVIPNVCNVVTILLLIGFTLAFGSLFSKTWRIYRIFTMGRSLKSRGIRDFHLLMVVFLMLVVDIVIICLWMTLSPWELQKQYLQEKVDNVSDTITTPVINRCFCKYDLQFVVATYFYKGLLMLFGLFVAWETKNIKVTVLNDSKYIGMSTYVVALFSAAAVIVTHALRSTTSFLAAYIIFAICIVSCTTVTLCLVFLPKIILLVRNYDDPNFRNGRPVLDGELSYSPSSTFPSISESETGLDSVRKQRSGTTTTATGSVILSSGAERTEDCEDFVVMNEYANFSQEKSVDVSGPLNLIFRDQRKNADANHTEENNQERHRRSLHAESRLIHIPRSQSLNSISSVFFSISLGKHEVANGDKMNNYNRSLRTSYSNDDIYILSSSYEK